MSSRRIRLDLLRSVEAAIGERCSVAARLIPRRASVTIRMKKSNSCGPWTNTSVPVAACFPHAARYWKCFAVWVTCVPIHSPKTVTRSGRWSHRRLTVPPCRLRWSTPSEASRSERRRRSQTESPCPEVLAGCKSLSAASRRMRAAARDMPAERPVSQISQFELVAGGTACRLPSWRTPMTLPSCR